MPYFSLSCLLAQAQVAANVCSLVKYTPPTTLPFYPYPPLRGWGGQFPVSFTSGHARLLQRLWPSPSTKSEIEPGAQPWRWLHLWYSIGSQSLRRAKCMGTKPHRSLKGSQGADSPWESHAQEPVFFPSQWSVSLKTSLSSNSTELSVYSAQRPLGLLSCCDSSRFAGVENSFLSLSLSLLFFFFQKTWETVLPAADLQFWATIAVLTL